MKAMHILQDADIWPSSPTSRPTRTPSTSRKTTGRDTGPDFAPASWWKYQHQTRDEGGKPLLKKQWQFTQELVREAWDKQFQSEVGLFSLARLLLSVFDTEQLQLLEEQSEGISRFYVGVDDVAEEYGFHKAVGYLTGGPSWRMKTCVQCRRYFVADHNGRKCCSAKCSYEHQIQRQQNRSREKNWYRPRKSKRRSSPRLPGGRSKASAKKVKGV